MLLYKVNFIKGTIQMGHNGITDLIKQNKKITNGSWKCWWKVWTDLQDFQFLHFWRKLRRILRGQVWSCPILEEPKRSRHFEIRKKRKSKKEETFSSSFLTASLASDSETWCLKQNYLEIFKSLIFENYLL